MDHILIISKHLGFLPASLQAHNLHLHLCKRDRQQPEVPKGPLGVSVWDRKEGTQSCLLVPVANFLSQFSFKEPSILFQPCTKGVNNGLIQMTPKDRYPLPSKEAQKRRQSPRSHTAESTDVTVSKREDHRDGK